MFSSLNRVTLGTEGCAASESAEGEGRGCGARRGADLGLILKCTRGFVTLAKSLDLAKLQLLLWNGGVTIALHSEGSTGITLVSPRTWR